MLLQSGLDEQWCADSMGCYCYLRNVQQLLADGKTSLQIDGALSGLSQFHQSGKTNLPGIVIGSSIARENFGKGDMLVADIEELANVDVSEIHARRLGAKEVMTPKIGEHVIFPVADGAVCLEEIMESEDPL